LNKELSEYRLIFIIALFLFCTVNALLISVCPENIVTSDSHLFGNETLSKYGQNFELKASDSSSTSSALKVEVMTISIPVSFNSDDNQLNNVNHQIKIYSKKKCSLISHNNLIVSKTLHLSPLITKLQI
jgi:hypothetical protein